MGTRFGLNILFVITLAAGVAVAAAPSARAASLSICHELGDGQSDCFKLEADGSSVVETSGAADDEPTTCLPAKDSKRKVFEGLVSDTFEKIKALPTGQRQLATPKTPGAILCDAYALRKGSETVWSCIETQGHTAHHIMAVMKQVEALCR